MKKRIPKTLVFLVLLAAAVAGALLLASCDAGGKDSPATHADSVVRIHIRANSNTAEDQGVKLEVRDALTGYLTEVLNGTEDKAAALAVLDGERGNIAKIAQDELYRNGFDYKVRVELKREVFPAPALLRARGRRRENSVQILGQGNAGKNLRLKENSLPLSP